MLGEKIQETVAKVTSTRVVTDNHGSPCVEISFAGQGTLLGIQTTEIGTYHSVMTPAGVLNGDGQGIVMSKDGDSLSWKGHGVGKPTGKGMGASYRYSLTMQTASTKWSRLNGVIAVGEWEVDENGNCKGAGWEWK